MPNTTAERPTSEDSDVHPVLKERTEESGIHKVTELDKDAERVYREGNNAHERLMEAMEQYEEAETRSTCDIVAEATAFLRQFNLLYR